MTVERRALIRTGVGLLTATALAFAALVSTAGPASAHDVLVGETPKNGSTVTTMPDKVTLVFNENVRVPSAMVVTDQAGARVDRGSAKVLDTTLSIDVRPGSVGRYTVAYRVLSADGHPVTGLTTFAYRPVGSALPPAPSSPTPAAAAPAAEGGHEHPRPSTGTTQEEWAYGGIAGLLLLGGLGFGFYRRWHPPLSGDEQ